MTIEEFSKKYEVSKRCVRKWISTNLIPGADIKTNYIPPSARCPYTSARAKKSKAVAISMIKAAIERKHILPQLYKMTDLEFSGHIDELVSRGLLRLRIEDGITYYDATMLAVEYQKNQWLDLVETTVRANAEGTTTAILKNAK